MSSKYLIIGIVILAVITGGYFLMKNPGYTAPTQDVSALPTQGPTAGNEVSTVQPTDTSKGTTTVEFTENGFVPQSLTVKVGTTVTFINNSANPFWVASDPHPTHTDLPGFDALKKISGRESYSFTFTKIGSWGYHNHLNPSAKGTVVVE